VSPEPIPVFGPTVVAPLVGIPAITVAIALSLRALPPAARTFLRERALRARCPRSDA
jgi:hypothetical protein